MTTRKKVAFVFATVLTVLALLGLFFTALLAVDVWTAVPPESDEIGENLGYGLGKAVALVLMIITMIATGICSIPGGIVSLVNRKVEQKPFRGLFISYSVANLVAAVGAVLLFAITAILA